MLQGRLEMVWSRRHHSIEISFVNPTVPWQLIMVVGCWVQVEQVLETYFMNLDNTYNKLQTLAEYVDDTEDYIKFEIDTQRNRFIEVPGKLGTCGWRCERSS
jgi:hypothetical protein